MRPTDDRIILFDARSDRVERFAVPVDASRGKVIVPRAVRIRDGALEWSQQAPGWDGTWSEAQYGEAGTAFHTRELVDDTVLDKFIELSGQPDARIAAFARRYGVLYVRPDGVPNSEPEEVEYPGETYRRAVLVKNHDGKGVHLEVEEESPVRWRRESLALWRDWSVVVRQLAVYGAILRNVPDRIDPESLLTYWGVEPSSPAENRWVYSQPCSLAVQLAYHQVGTARDGTYRPTTGDEQRRVLGGWLDLLTGYAGLTVRLGWEGRAPESRIDRSRWEGLGALTNTPNAVFGDVMVQLVNWLVSDRRRHVCPDCGEVFDRPGRERSCDPCRQKRRRASKRQTWAKNGEMYNAKRRAEGRTT